MKKLTLSVACLAAVSVFGQVKDSVNTKDVEEVILTASRKKENIKEVPGSVTVVSEKQIQSQLAVNSDITSVLQYTVPSLGNSTGQTSNTGQTLRGRQFLVLIDGVPQSTPLRNGGRDLRVIDPSALERVEVIKGASAIYGNGADGGIINYITKRNRTDKKKSGTTQLGLTGQPYGGTLGFRASQLLAGKLNDKFDYVLSLAYERTGKMKDANGDNLSPTYSIAKMDNYNGMLKLGYNINENQRIEASYIGYAAKSDLDLGIKTGKYGVTPTIGYGSSDRLDSTPQGTPRNHNFRIAYDNKNLFSGTSLNFNAYNQDFRTVYGYSNSFKGGGQSNIVSKKSGARLNLDTQLWNVNNSSAEIIYGFDLLHDNTAQKLEDGRAWTPDMKMTNLAPFALVKIDLLKKLILKAGVRYENININISDFERLETLVANTGNYRPPLSIEGGSLKYNAFVANAGIRYNLQPFINLFASFSQAFSLNELGRILRDSNENTISQIRTEPVIVNNYELGATGQIRKWLNYEITSYISTSKLGAAFRQNAQTGWLELQRAPEIIYGIEGYLNFTPTNWLNFGGSYSYIIGLQDADDNGSYEAKLNGSRITSPKVLSYIQIKPTKKFMFSVDMLNNFKYKEFSPNPKTGAYAYGEGPVPAYMIFNFKSEYQVNNQWKVSLGIENLFNKTYQGNNSWWTSNDINFTNALGMRSMLMLEYKF